MVFQLITFNRRGSIPLWIQPSAYTKLYFLTQGSTAPHPRGKLQTSAQTKVAYPPVQICCWNFLILRIFSSNFCLPTSNLFWAAGGGKTNFLKKITHIFLGYGKAERKNDRSDTTSALFKNLVCQIVSYFG